MPRRREDGPKLPRQWAHLPYVVRTSVNGWTGGQLYSYAKDVASGRGFKVIIEYPKANGGKFGYPGSYDSGILTLSKDTVKDPVETRKRRLRALVVLVPGWVSAFVGWALISFYHPPVNWFGFPFLGYGAWAVGSAVTGRLQSVYRGSLLVVSLQLSPSQKPPVRTMSTPIIPAELLIVGGRALTLGPPGTELSRVYGSSEDSDCGSVIAELAAGLGGQAPLPGGALA